MRRPDSSERLKLNTGQRSNRDEFFAFGSRPSLLTDEAAAEERAKDARKAERAAKKAAKAAQLAADGGAPAVSAKPARASNAPALLRRVEFTIGTQGESNAAELHARGAGFAVHRVWHAGQTSNADADGWSNHATRAEAETVFAAYLASMTGRGWRVTKDTAADAARAHADRPLCGMPAQVLQETSGRC